jgi:endonuclease/exonuclease/phosphatase family metal-dependent hydrolase
MRQSLGVPHNDGRVFERMRLATWNLERVSSTEPRAHRVREIMRSIRADVWILTETDERLAPEHGMTPVSSSTPERPHRPGERWVSIWTRSEQCEPVPTADPVRTACVRMPRQTGASLLIYGTVLPWRADIRFRPLRGGDAFCHALAEQAEDWAALRRSYPNHILCVAGDFNQEATRPCRVGTAKGLRELSQALASNDLVCVSGGTSDPLSRRTAGARSTIDHICLTSAAATLTSRVESWPDALEGLTDHFGTSVELADA